MAVLFTIIYLLIPVMGIAHCAVVAGGGLENRSGDRVVATPCEHCPCSDEQGSHSCDTTSCSCDNHSPPVLGGQLLYAPEVITARPGEFLWSLPQVYLTIVVPPQKHYDETIAVLIV